MRNSNRKNGSALLDAAWLGRRIQSAGDMGIAPPEGIRRASVFLPLFDKHGAPHILALLKADTRGYPWRNQVALPGGHVDTADRTPLETAFRELKEEVGIDAKNLLVAGSMGHFPTIQNTVIEVFVAVWNGQRDQLTCDPKEIARLIEVPVDKLRETHRSKRFSKRDPGIGELIYPWEDVQIWGVTARIIHFFLEHIDG